MPLMRTRPAIRLVVLGPALLAMACSSSPLSNRTPGHGASSSPAPSASSSAPIPADLASITIQVAAPPDTALSGPFDLQRFIQKLSDSPNQDSATLQGAGFLNGYDRLGGPNNSEAVYLYRFGGPAGAGQAMNGFLAEVRPRTGYSEFSVSGVNGATGYTFLEPAQSETVQTVLFVRNALLVQVSTFSTNLGFGTARVIEMAKQESTLMGAA
jgi:hypothetical protein